MKTKGMKTKGMKTKGMCKRKECVNERNQMKTKGIKYIYSNYELKLTLNKIL